MPLKVLIAEDAVFVQEIWKGVLKNNGYDVVGVAANGKEAVEMAESLSPDLVIMDIVMPELNGIEATKQILAKKPEIKVIACSSEKTEHLLLQATKAGCVEYITKPFEVEDVLKVLSSV